LIFGKTTKKRPGLLARALKNAYGRNLLLTGRAFPG
jgi:hypothetical protein